jgi:hypothetical protein
MSRSVPIMGYADDTNILDRFRLTVNKTYTTLENQATIAGLTLIPTRQKM